MATIPRDRSVDSTLAFRRAGYRFISNRCERHGSDIFETRLLLERTICMRGRPAAVLFYDNERFARHGAAPKRAQKTLFGQGGVQDLDGAAHRERKAMLMSLMTPAAIRELAQIFAEQWQNHVDVWSGRNRVVLHDEIGVLLLRAVCAWAGVPLRESEVRQRRDDQRAMIEAPVLIGPRYWRGKLARVRSERWLQNLIERVRTSALPAPAGGALQVLADHRDPQGRLLPAQVAAVDLLNIIRPTVAIDRFIAFAALALHQHPEWRERIRTQEDAAELFVQEVRRFYPFFPTAAARVRQSFEWQGYYFPRGRRVLLDLYGTDHHPDLWADPERFYPERFRGWTGDAFSLIPQGGGDHYSHHRCAGEWITIELMKVAVRELTTGMRYDVPKQDLTVSLRQQPALPASGFVMTNVRRVE